MTDDDNEKKTSLLGSFIAGSIVSGRFFVKHWLQLFICLALMLIYMTNRFSCAHSMEQISRLKTRLEVVETRAVRTRGIYMSRIRESAMRQRLDSMGIPLTVQNQPPYRLDREK